MRITKNENICIIPARGGSKRLPGKNLKFFFGKPIIFYVINKVKKTNFFDKIIVSTDSADIAKYSKKLGAHVHLRSKHYSRDNAKFKDVIANIINDSEIKDSKYKKICCFYPTSIFFKVSDLRLAFKKLKRNINFIFTAKKYDHPIERAFKKKGNSLQMFNTKMEMKNTQNLPIYYYDAAQFYLGWFDSWKKRKKIFQGKSDFIEIPKLNSQDIDNYKDWQNAKILWKLGNIK